MNESEVFNEITSKLKWYVGYCSQSYATQLKQKFQDGRLREEAKNNLFNHFGYEIKTEAQWQKK